MKRKYQEVLNIIENSRRFENRPGREITSIMLEKLGKPQENIPYIHVAGTNGKGSVCTFASTILMAAGLRVGTFTSPHLIDFEERITINGQRISRQDVERIGNQLLDMDFGVKPTMFDYCLAMAVIYFKEKACDVMVIETGLGGRLDSTNALGVPQVSVITKIGYDHMAILGNSLSEIAREKAGIIKKGSQVVIETQEESALLAIKAYIQENDLEDKDMHFLKEEQIQEISSLPLQIQGVHQWENGLAAREACSIFCKKQGIEISEAILKDGLCKAYWPGRMEIISKDPFILVDGAHNSNGVAALKASLMKMYPDQKFHFIMAVMADKDYPLMIEEILPLAEDFITLNTASDRALQAKELAEFIKGKGVEAHSAASIEEALSIKNPKKTVIFGSLYFIGDVKAFLQK